jgi:hypothetical protein
MHFHGIFWNDSWIHYFKGKLPNPKKSTYNNEHVYTTKFIVKFKCLMTMQFYKCFIKDFVTIMVLITKFTRKIEGFLWIDECQKPWELIK